VNPFGPVQLYVAPDMVDAVRLRVPPAHTGVLLPAVGAAGKAFTVTVVDTQVELPQPFSQRA